MLDDDSSLSQGTFPEPTEPLKVGVKRPLTVEVFQSSLANAKEDVKRRSKKFRVEWMEEDHFKDWLQPHPSDDTLCYCIACDINLRCGKSELEKHASGMKHSRRLEDMKADPTYQPLSQRLLALNAETQPKHCIENGSVWSTSQEEAIRKDGVNGQEDNETLSHPRTGVSEQTLTEAIVKLFEFADGKMELSKRRLEMAEAEHACKMQILEKELQIKSLEVQLKGEELKKIQLEVSQLVQKDKVDSMTCLNDR